MARQGIQGSESHSILVPGADGHILQIVQSIYTAQINYQAQKIPREGQVDGVHGEDGQDEDIHEPSEGQVQALAETRYNEVYVRSFSTAHCEKDRDWRNCWH